MDENNQLPVIADRLQAVESIVKMNTSKEIKNYPRQYWSSLKNRSGLRFH